MMRKVKRDALDDALESVRTSFIAMATIDEADRQHDIADELHAAGMRIDDVAPRTGGRNAAEVELNRRRARVEQFYTVNDRGIAVHRGVVHSQALADARVSFDTMVRRLRSEIGNVTEPIIVGRWARIAPRFYVNASDKRYVIGCRRSDRANFAPIAYTWIVRKQG